jgi:hypothetical protein
MLVMFSAVAGRRPKRRWRPDRPAGVSSARAGVDESVMGNWGWESSNGLLLTAGGGDGERGREALRGTRARVRRRRTTPRRCLSSQIPTIAKQVHRAAITPHNLPRPIPLTRRSPRSRPPKPAPFVRVGASALRPRRGQRPSSASGPAPFVRVGASARGIMRPRVGRTPRRARGAVERSTVTKLARGIRRSSPAHRS